MKKIKLKKKVRFRMKNLFFTIICLILFFLSFSFFNNINLYSNNEEFIMNLLNNSNHYKKYEKKNIIKKIGNYLYKIDLQKPNTIIANMLNYDDEEIYYPEVLQNITEHIKDPSNEVIDKPIVYIYNSHQLENYSSSNYEPYNITPNVMMASYLLKEKLNNLDIPSIVEENDITDFIKVNSWDYNYSYTASRYFINAAKDKYPSIKYYIDIHRDSALKDQTTITINNMNYAKVLFVIGLEHENYQKNLDLATKINNLLISGISRGIVKKSGPNVNGIYNQDISENAILIEIGGYQNKIDEVLNTVNELSKTLKEIINEN